MGFFDTKQAAAVFKHALLEYVYPFASKTGKRSIDHRVAVVDGYAGEGRYEDDQAGSPVHLIEIARRAARVDRRVELHLVEAAKAPYAKLQRVLGDELAEGPPVNVSTYLGPVEDHLSTVLGATSSIPLFVFLDPYGFAVPFTAVCEIFKRPAGLGAPGTEVLINFSMHALRRTAGHLTSPTPVEATLARMDSVCGGDWWRDVWRENAADPAAAEQAVVFEYARRLAQPTGTGWWAVDVRPRPDRRPVYYLLFFSRHPDGLQIFGETVSLGLSKWRMWVARAQWAREDSLFDSASIEEQIAAEEARLVDSWVDQLERNVREILAAGADSFTVRSRYGEVYAGVVGVAREMHLRKALKRIYEEGLLAAKPTGDLMQYVVRHPAAEAGVA